MQRRGKPLFSVGTHVIISVSPGGECHPTLPIADTLREVDEIIKYYNVRPVTIRRDILYCYTDKERIGKVVAFPYRHISVLNFITMDHGLDGARTEMIIDSVDEMVYINDYPDSGTVYNLESRSRIYLLELDNGTECDKEYCIFDEEGLSAVIH